MELGTIRDRLHDEAVTSYSKRLPHVLPPVQLARLLAPTYSAAHLVDEEEAYERLARAFGSPELVDEMMAGIGEALEERRGPRTTEDALIDRLSRGIQKRGPIKAGDASPAISAALTRIDIEIGVASETLRAPLATEKGKALLREGWRALGAWLVRDLLR